MAREAVIENVPEWQPEDCDAVGSTPEVLAPLEWGAVVRVLLVQPAALNPRTRTKTVPADRIDRIKRLSSTPKSVHFCQIPTYLSPLTRLPRIAEGATVPAPVVGLRHVVKDETVREAPIVATVGTGNFRRPRTDLIGLGIVVGVAAGLRLEYVLSAKARLWEDSVQYAGVAGHPLLSVAFWSGREPPLVPLMLKVASSSTGFSALEASIAVLAWTILAWTVWLWLGRGLRGVAAAAALLAFSLTPFVLQWDASVLSESVSLSAVALIFAAVLWLTRRFTWVRASLLIGACLMFELARDEGIVSVAALGVGIGIIAIIHGARHRSEIALRCAIVAVLILVMAMSVELAATHTHRNALNVEHSLFVRVFPSPNAVAWFSAHGMPQAAAIDLAADAAKVGDAFQDTYLLPKPTPQTAEVVSLVISTHYWKPLRDWISTSGESAYLRYLLSHPGFVVSAPFHRPSLAFNSPSSIAFYQIHGHHFVPGLSVLFPRRVFVLAMALLAAVLMAIKRIWRRREVLFLSLMAPLGFFTMAVGWFGDGEEVARHMIEGNVMVRLAVLLLLLWAIFGRVSPRVTEDVSL